MLHGWELKPYAILHSPFSEVLFLDADNVPVVNPEFLFDTPQFQTSGAIFWPDYGHAKQEKAMAVWRSCGLRRPKEPEFESGQIVLDKKRCWAALCLCLWFNENSDFYYQHLHGDKETFRLAFRKLKQPYSLVPKQIHALAGTMCQHDFHGRRIFQHRNTDKWDLFLHNQRVEDFWFENECRDYLAQLRRDWDGGMRSQVRIKSKAPTRPKLSMEPLRIEAVMISCAERDELRRQTLSNFARTDWGDAPVHVHLDDDSSDDHRQRQTNCAYLALKETLQRDADYILFLEDDLDFNHHIRHNLHNWGPVKNQTVTLASLYNPRVRELACDLRNNARIVEPHCVFGSQAFLISRPTVEYLLQHWKKVDGMQDIKISRLAGLLGNPIFYHAPSLVQHIGVQSVWGGCFHQAMDFDQGWTA